MQVADALRHSPVADRIRSGRLVVVLRRVEPQSRLLGLVGELRDAAADVIEITFDAPDAARDLAACREAFPGLLLGAGTIRGARQIRAAQDAGAAFLVSPVLDPDVLAGGIAAGLPTVPGAYTPTEADRAWRAGATFVKLFPASSMGPAHIRELRGPLPEIEVIPTGGIDASNAAAFLDAGAVAVGIGSAIVRATPDERRALVAAVRRS